MGADFDVIVIGARVAGSSTGMLLARRGLRVLVVDRARFPSDTLSSHQLQLPGVACLARWGLLDRLVATGVPPTREVRFDAGSAVLHARVRPHAGVDAMYSPRRTVLDSLLVAAAREAGAQVEESFDVQEILVEDGRVTGVRGRHRGSRTGPTCHRAELVVGADGKHSVLADAVAAGSYHESPPRSAACYAYWTGLQLSGGEMYGRPRRVVGAWPTHEGLAVTYVGMPSGDFAAARRDINAALLGALDDAGDLGRRARAATLVEHVRATNDLPHRFRQPYGRGWALVGDAGLVLDPITGQGIGHALQDAEHLAEAVSRVFAGTAGWRRAMRRYQRERDAARLPMHRFTGDLASFRPAPGSDALFRAIAASPELSDRFIGVLGGTESPSAFFGPRNIQRMLGWRATWAMLRSSAPARAA